MSTAQFVLESGTVIDRTATFEHSGSSECSDYSADEYSWDLNAGSGD